MTDSEQFLKNRMSIIIGKTRNPVCLADKLLETGEISNEIYNIIRNKTPHQEQIREIYKNINSKRHYDVMYEWLKRNETGMLNELEKSDAEAEAPPRKRFTDSETHQTVDETDNNSTESPDLKIISTFPKLETWVSENSQKLISDLEGKLGEGGLEDLKKELKDKESKNNLCLKPGNIDDIRKNKELDVFLTNKKSRKIPQLTLEMFFRSSCASSGKKIKTSTDHDELMDTNTGESNSSGYGSQKSDQSVVSLSLNGEQAAGEDRDFTEDKDNKDVQETHSDEMDGKPQPPGQSPNVSPNVSPNCPNEPITKTQTPLEGTRGDMEEIEEANMQNNSESSSDLLVKNIPVSGFNNMSSKGSWDERGKIKVEIVAQNQDTAVPAPGDTQDTVRQADGSSTGFLTSTSGAAKVQAGEAETEPVLVRNERGSRKENKLEKKNHVNKLLRDWALRQCDGSEEEMKNVFKQISIINMAEHRDYPCFTAENVSVYENPRTSERQIIFIADKRMAMITAKTMAHYHMFVCDLQKAVLLGPKEETEQVIKYEEGFIRIDKCKRFISEVFAPTLAVFKKIQEEELYSLI